jgi:phage terminase large subunit GpA-like protein
LKYEKDAYDDVKYQCCECGELIEEFHKTNMLAAGEWIPKFPEKEDGYTFGYHISAMYSPYGMYSWKKMAKDYEDAQGNTPKMIVFTNTKLGKCYEAVEAEKPDWQNIFDRAEDYNPDEPFASVAFLTAGVDVQKDRLQIEVVGWMKGKTSQSVAYIQLVGDTSQDDVWKQLAEVIDRPFIRQGDGAAMPIRLMAVDTGYNTERVYQFTKNYSTQRVVPIKGNASLDMYFSAPKAVEVVKAGKKLGKVKVWHVGVSMLKSEIYGLVKKRIDLETGVIPNGYCHFPKRDQTYFRGLIGEELQQVISKKGFEGYQWVKTYKRNEPLDCRVYAQAAAYIVGMDRWKDEQWEKAVGNYEVQSKPQSILENKIKKRRRSSFWDR